MSGARKSGAGRWPDAAWNTIRLSLCAVLLGAAAGAAACVTYLAMIALQQAIWSNAGESRLLILPLTVLGGVLVGWTRLQGPGIGIEGQIAAARSPEATRLRETFWLGLGAIFAVGFGGAIGPEAGILAVTAQLSAVISVTLGRTAAERRVLASSGLSGALSGVYGSPAGGPMHAEAEERAPKAILFAAGLAGFAAFVLLAEALRPGALALMHLPRLTADPGNWDTLIAIVPAMAGALSGVVFLVFSARASDLLARHLPSSFWQPVAGGAALGLLAIGSPLILYSGHGEIVEMLEIGRAHGPLPLILLSLGKALACALCVATGWRGGLAFPMCFVGGAMGAAMLFVVPGGDPLLGVAAGMSAAAAVGMTRPFVAGLIMLFILGSGLAIPVFVGTLVGWAALQLLPPTLTAQSGAHGG